MMKDDHVLQAEGIIVISFQHYCKLSDFLKSSWYCLLNVIQTIKVLWCSILTGGMLVGPLNALRINEKLKSGTNKPLNNSLQAKNYILLKRFLTKREFKIWKMRKKQMHPHVGIYFILHFACTRLAIELSANYNFREVDIVLKKLNYKPEKQKQILFFSYCNSLRICVFKSLKTIFAF